MAQSNNSTPDGFGLVITERQNNQWVIIEINDAELANTGYSRNEMIGKNPEKVMETLDSDRAAIAQAQKTVAGGEPAYFTSRLRRKDGSIYAARSLVRGEYDKKDALIRCHYVSFPIDADDSGLFTFGKQEMMNSTERMTGMGSWQYSLSQDKTTVSDNAFKILDILENNRITDKFTDQFPPELTKIIHDHNQKCLQEGTPYRQEYQFISNNGIELYGTISGEAEYDDAGNIVGIIGVICDFSDQANMRIEHNMFLRAANLGSIRIDGKKDFLALSAEAAKLLGYPEQPIQISTADWSAKIHPQDKEQASLEYEKSLVSQKPAIRRYRLQHQNGAWRWYELRSHARFDTTGKPLIVYATIMDVDESVRTAQKVIESKNRFNDVLAHTRELIFEMDANNIFTYVSDMASRIFGYSCEEMIGMDARQLYTPNNPGLAKWEQEQPNFEVHDVERQMQTKDGQKIHIHITSIAIYDQLGNITGYRGSARDITQQKSVQLALQISEARFRNVLSQSKDVIYELDENGYFRYISDNGPELFGYSHEEILKLNTYDLIADPPTSRTVWISERNTHGAIDTEILLKRKDGSKLFVHYNSKPIVDESGKVTGFCGAARDISRKKATQQKLEVSEERYMEAIRNAHGCVFEVDANGYFTYLSDSSLQVLSYAPHELIGKPTYILSNKPPQNYQQWVKQLHENGGYSLEEQKLYKRDGSSNSWLRITSHAMHDEQGNICGFRGTAFDITDRKIMDLKLEKSQRRLTEVVTTAQGWIFDLDIDGCFTYSANHIPFFAKNGLSIEFLRGKPTYFMAPKLKSRHQEWLDSIRSTPEGVVSEIQLSLPGGTEQIWAQVHCICRFDENGSCFGFRGVAFDITVKKQAELETICAKEAAEQSAEERARFLTTMSHEIRTPLNAVIGMTDLLLATEQNKEQTKLTKTANMAGQHLLSVVNDILDHAKLDSGKVILEEIAFNPVNEVKTVQEILTANAEAKDIALTSDINSNLAQSYIGDPSRIRQILLNLVGNAIKFTETGTISIAIDSQPKDRVRFTVTDTGIGIAREAQKHLFNDFAQADASTTRIYGGTGLGLAICKRLVAVMKGSIGVVSKPAQGAKFWFEIPLPPVKKSKLSQAGIIEKPASTKLTQYKILVAEDNPANQLLMQTLLSKLDQDVTIVENGKLAVEAASACKFDLIFMDIQMPKMDGYTAARTLRELGNPVPIIALTANVIKDEEDKFREAGMNDWLSKPFNLSDLVERLGHWGNIGRANLQPNQDQKPAKALQNQRSTNR